MKNEKDILNEALDSMKQAPTPELPAEVLSDTLAQLAKAGADDGVLEPSERTTIRLLPLVVKFTAAAAVFLLVGYAIGRMSGPDPVDLDELHNALLPSLASALEPSLRESLLEDASQRQQLALAGAYLRLRDELTEQQRSEMNRYAAQTLAASNAVTNRLLADLVQSIKDDQTQELRSVAAVIHEIEQERLAAQERLTNDLIALAHQTEDGLKETREELVQLVVNRSPDLSGQPDSSKEQDIH